MLALFFHDAIYDPTTKDNEVQSANWAKQVIKEVGLPNELGEKVAQYIRATDHSKMSPNFFVQIICDIDLSQLGCPAEQYEANTAKIRQEYQMFSKDDFLDGRNKFTESILARQSIYQTWYFQEKYEKQPGKIWLSPLFGFLNARGFSHGFFVPIPSLRLSAYGGMST